MPAGETYVNLTTTNQELSSAFWKRLTGYSYSLLTTKFMGQLSWKIESN